jgi:hypothetical protein
MNVEKKNVYGAIAGAMAFLASLLPCFKFGEDVLIRLIETENGVVFMGLAIIGVIAALCGKDLITSLAGCLLIGFYYEKFSRLKEVDTFIWGDQVIKLVTKEYGYYVFIISSVGMILTGLVGFIKKRKDSGEGF